MWVKLNPLNEIISIRIRVVPSLFFLLFLLLFLGLLLFLWSLFALLEIIAVFAFLLFLFFLLLLVFFLLLYLLVFVGFLFALWNLVYPLKSIHALMFESWLGSNLNSCFVETQSDSRCWFRLCISPSNSFHELLHLLLRQTLFIISLTHAQSSIHSLLISHHSHFLLRT